MSWNRKDLFVIMRERHVLEQKGPVGHHERDTCPGTVDDLSVIMRERHVLEQKGPVRHRRRETGPGTVNDLPVTSSEANLLTMSHQEANNCYIANNTYS